MRSLFKPLLTWIVITSAASSCINRDTSLIFPDAKVIDAIASPDIKTAVAQHIIVSEDILGSVAIHSINESQLILMDMAGDYCFKWIDLTSNETIGLVRRGRGPGEMDFAGFGGTWKEGDDVMFDAYSINMKKVYTINLTESIIEKQTVIRDVTDIPSNTMYSMTDGKQRVCYTLEPNSIAIKLLSMDGSSQGILLPFGTEDYIASGDHFFAATSLSPEGDKLIIAMTSFPCLAVIDLKGGSNKVTIASNTDERTILASLQDIRSELPDCYSAVQVTDKRIYALCMAGEDDLRHGIAQELQIFNASSLKLESKIKLSEYLINFAVSSNEKEVIGITPDSELLRYSLQ